MFNFFNRLGLVLGVILGTMLLMVAPAFADAADPVTSVSMSAPITALVISLLVSTVLPVVTGFVTSEHWNSFLKFTILGALSAATSFVTQWGVSEHDHTSFSWQASVIAALLSWGTAEATYVRGWAKTRFGHSVAAGPAFSLNDPGPTQEYAATVIDTTSTPTFPRHEADGVADVSVGDLTAAPAPVELDPPADAEEPVVDNSDVLGQA